MFVAILQIGQREFIGMMGVHFNYLNGQRMVLKQGVTLLSTKVKWHI